MMDNIKYSLGSCLFNTQRNSIFIILSLKIVWQYIVSIQYFKQYDIHFLYSLRYLIPIHIASPYSDAHRVSHITNVHYKITRHWLDEISNIEKCPWSGITYMIDKALNPLCRGQRTSPTHLRSPCQIWLSGLGLVYRTLSTHSNSPVRTKLVMSKFPGQ